MGAFDADSQTVRNLRGAEVVAALTGIDSVAGFLEERRDRFLAILDEIRADPAGDFEPGDVGAMRALIAQQRTRFRNLGGSFDPGPP